jgi:hypothetical protein
MHDLIMSPLPAMMNRTLSKEVLRSLLHSDPAEEEHDLLVSGDGFEGHLGAVGQIDGVVDDLDFLLGHAVPVADDIGRHVTDGDDAIGAVHARPLDVVDHLIDPVAGAVEFGAVDVDDQRSSGRVGYGRGGGERHPIVRVDDVERLPAGELNGQAGVTTHLLHQVIPIVRPGPADHQRTLRRLGLRGRSGGLDPPPVFPENLADEFLGGLAASLMAEALKLFVDAHIAGGVSLQRSLETTEFHVLELIFRKVDDGHFLGGRQVGGAAQLNMRGRFIGLGDRHGRGQHKAYLDPGLIQPASQAVASRA